MICRTPRRGLVGAWCPSLRAGGYVLEDRSEVRYNGTLTNSPTWSAGALSLTAANSQYVAVWDSSRCNQFTFGEMSISAWVNPTSTASRNCIASTINAGGAQGNFYIEINAGGTIRWLQSGSQVDALSVATVSANKWSFVAATRRQNGANWDITLYINNVRETFSSANGPNTATTGTLSIGRAGAFNGLYFGGLIDDVRIWNRCLGPAEMQAVGTARGYGLIPQRARRPKAGSQLYTRVGGVWKTATPWIKVGGVWKQATPALNVSGTWK